MFDLIPFEHRNNDLFRYFDDMERAFFGGNTDIAPCKTDILDEGNRFVLKADLPGFKKEDIHLDIEGRPFDDLRGTHRKKTKRKIRRTTLSVAKEVWFHEPQFDISFHRRQSYRGKI